MSRLSLSDIDRWDPGAINQVFGAAITRASDTRAVGTQVGNLTTFEGWDGDTADAARDSAQRIIVDLNAHADTCEAVASAAQSAVGKVEAVKARLAQIRAEVQFGITIDNESNDVRPPADVASRPNARVIQLLVDDLQRMVNQVVSDAELADDDLAAAIRAADGTLSPKQVTDQLDGGPVSIPFPPASGEPHEVNKWWDSMTPQQQREAANRFGDILGNTDGVPSGVRSDINLSRLDREIAKQEALAAQRKFLSNGGPDPKVAEEVRLARAKLDDLNGLKAALAKHPEAGLLLLDTTSKDDRVLAATFVGDIDNADHVSVTTPGMNTRVGTSIDGMTGEAQTMQAQAQALAKPGEKVASIAWIGYETPGMDLDVATDNLAKAGAVDLNHFYQGLDATTNVGDQHLTALGHSYGSLTTSLALQQGAPVDDVVLYGSPGGELSNASDLGVAPGHAFFEVAKGDAVPIDIARSGSFGGQIQDVPGMVPLSTEGAWGPNNKGEWVFHEESTGHSEYPRQGGNGNMRTSAYNMAAVVAGNPHAVIGGPAEPQTTHNPRGWVIPNPDYHS